MRQLVGIGHLAGAIAGVDDGRQTFEFCPSGTQHCGWDCDSRPGGWGRPMLSMIITVSSSLVMVPSPLASKASKLKPALASSWRPIWRRFELLLVGLSGSQSAPER